MRPFAEIVGVGVIDMGDELFDDTEDWIADCFGLLTEKIPVDEIDVACGYDGVGGGLGDDVERGLDLCESRFEEEIVLCSSSIGPDFCGWRMGEDIAEYEGVLD